VPFKSNWGEMFNVNYTLPVDKLKGPIERLSFIQDEQHKDKFHVTIDPIIDEYNYQEPLSTWNYDTAGYYIDHTIINNRFMVFLFSK